jgi:hypothetical protein
VILRSSADIVEGEFPHQDVWYPEPSFSLTYSKSSRSSGRWTCLEPRGPRCSVVRIHNSPYVISVSSVPKSVLEKTRSARAPRSAPYVL